MMMFYVDNADLESMIKIIFIKSRQFYLVD